MIIVIDYYLALSMHLHNDFVNGMRIQFDLLLINDKNAFLMGLMNGKRQVQTLKSIVIYALDQSQVSILNLIDYP